MPRFLTLFLLLMLPMASVRPADAERSGIRGTFFDLISDPWKESADLKDEAVAARFVTDGLLVIVTCLVLLQHTALPFFISHKEIWTQLVTSPTRNTQINVYFYCVLWQTFHLR